MLVNQNDRSHARCAHFARATTDHQIIPVTVLPEVAYLLDSRLGHHVMQQFIANVAQPNWTVMNVEQIGLQRAAAIVRQDQDLWLDFVDATEFAIAERLGLKRILTLDLRHFSAIRPAHCTAFELLPA